MHPSRYLPRPLPEVLQGLADLAVDLRWSWNHSADALWHTVEPEMWDATGDPWLILETVSQQRLDDLAKDADFVNALQRQLAERDEYQRMPAWFSENHPPEALRSVAYFSMEFGLSEALPIYSGGLGILAGDHLKTASDLGVPLVGVGLLYQQGYFHQAVDANGEQLAFYPYNNPAMLPVMPLRGESGEWLRISVDMPGRTVHLRGWQAQVGRVSLYLLDSNDLRNAPGDRGITGELYGGGTEMRLQQEMLLGIGGWRLVQALDVGCDVCHLNEGHAAFAVLERARGFMQKTNQPFSVALNCTRSGNIFTTHTSVEAGFDRYAPELMAQYFSQYAHDLGIGMDELLALGRPHHAGRKEPFNMAYLAMNGSCAINGVSRLHGEVSRKIFQPLFSRWPRSEVPVGHVTNGVHTPSWDSAAADRLWTNACGKSRWLGTMETVEQQLRDLPDEVLWTARAQGRKALVGAVRQRLARQCAMRGGDSGTITACFNVLDPNALTVGFARRFATYKRPDLLLHDQERLIRLLNDRERPLQLVIAGKAHPHDDGGKEMIKRWAKFITRPEVEGLAVFVEDYDLALAAELVQGVDVWLNTPRRPWEASGTSGMKVLVNGGLNFSELDGWWAEAYTPGAGWALGDGQEHSDNAAWDKVEAEKLCDILEHEVIPAFYDRDSHGIPTAWVARMRESMAHLTPRFSTNRMVREYTEHYYLPASAAYQRRAADNGRLGKELEEWKATLQQHWARVHFGKLAIWESGDHHGFQVQVYLDDLEAEAVQVELYADPIGGSPPERHTMHRGEPLTGAVNSYIYIARVPATRPASDYTPRLVPYHPDAQVPLEVPLIAWQR